MEYQKFLQEQHVPQQPSSTRNIVEPKKTPSIKSNNDNNTTESDDGTDGGKPPGTSSASRSIIGEWIPLSVALYTLLSLAAY
jgi:hypothetical protein